MSNIVIPDGGNIGSASDTDAISIAANGKPTFSAGIANTGTIDAGTIGTGVTINAGSNVSGIGQLVGVGFGTNSAGSDTNDVTADLNKDYTIWIYAWNGTSAFSHMEIFTATGDGSSHTFVEKIAMNGGIGVGAGSGGAGTIKGFTDSPFAYVQMFVFENGTGFDIS